VSIAKRRGTPQCCPTCDGQRLDDDGIECAACVNARALWDIGKAVAVAPSKRPTEPALPAVEDEP
jgi:hypothetical protein